MSFVKGLANSTLTYVPNMNHICPNTAPLNVSGFHLNASHSKTQAFTWPKTHQNEISERNLKMRKKFEKLTDSAMRM